MTPEDQPSIDIEGACCPTGSVEFELPPCQIACPVGTDIPSYVGLIWDGNLKEALEVITATNPFSSICGRVCASPCESACKRSAIDGPVAIRNLKRFVTDELAGDDGLPVVQPTRKEIVAVVGGGPTGLTAAQDLAVAGFRVHLYECSDRLGGMMNAIPRFRLPPELIQGDIQRLLDRCPGIEVHLGEGLGEGITLTELKADHDAVLITIGLWKDRSLGVPGEDLDLDGCFGIDFLGRISNGESISLSGQVVVVGGGNVAMDTARTALRCGKTEVHLYCLESREEMPAWDHEIEQAEAEGVVIHNGWGPETILSADGRVTGIRFTNCLSVFDEAGCFHPVYGKETLETAADAVLTAIGLMADCPELNQVGLLDRGKIQAPFAGMQTSDSQVFAAGDCAFGPSAIVYAMDHGHRAAYYVQAFLDGVSEPVYRRPLRSRHIPVAQEPMWEKTPRENAAFYGRGEDSCSFEECEGVFDPDTASQQAGRCLRCDAETGTANYSKKARNMIQTMATIEYGDHAAQAKIFNELLVPRENPFPANRPAHMDDVVFLSAALTRLVIDPYREDCSTKTCISAIRDVVSRHRQEREVVLDKPYLFTGFDDAPAPVQQALFSTLADTGCGYIGRIAPNIAGDEKKKATWFQLVLDGDEPSPEAQSLIYVLGSTFSEITPERLYPNQLIGISVSALALKEAIPFALDNAFDFIVLDGTAGVEKPWAELKGFPDLTVISEAIRILREMNREEDIALISFGGMRSGTDVAKVLAMNCNAGVFAVPAGIAMGGVIADDALVFPDGVSVEACGQALANWIKGTAQETAIIARCTGKTSVHNLEREDMRTISIAASEAMNLPLTSGPVKREWF